jgi:hypothetical protein
MEQYRAMAGEGNRKNGHPGITEGGVSSGNVFSRGVDKHGQARVSK